MNGQQRCGEDPTDYAYEGSLGWIIAATPRAETPEVALPLLLPFSALTLGGIAYGINGRRSRRRAEVAVS